MKRHCIIVAGGKGLRMRGEIPKQFMLFNGKPLLMHTLNMFRNFDSEMHIILALPFDQIDEWEKLCLRYSFQVEVHIVHGGETRFHSVKNALDVISEEGVVAVHDGVRPLITNDLLDRYYTIAEKEGNAIPCIPVSESMRKIDTKGNQQVDRSKYVLIQTPQVFHTSILRKGYSQPYENSFTDDASVIEKMGISVKLVDGDTNNIKITTKTDLIMAESILSVLQ